MRALETKQKQKQKGISALVDGPNFHVTLEVVEKAMKVGLHLLT